MTDTTINTERCPDCAATAPYWRPDDRECEICLVLAEMPDEIDEIVEALDNLPGILGADYGAVQRLRQLHGLLAEHVRGLAAEVGQLHSLVAIVRETEWGSGKDESYVKVCGAPNDAYDYARAYGEHVFTRKLYAGPWSPDVEEGDDD